MTRSHRSSTAPSVIEVGDLTRAVGSLEPELLEAGSDPKLDRWISAMCRRIGVTVAALCLYDGPASLIKSHRSATGSSERTGRLAAGESFEGHLRESAGASVDASCVVAVDAVVVNGSIVGNVGMADCGRAAWSTDDLAALSELASVVSSAIEVRLVRAEAARARQMVGSYNRVHDMIARRMPLREVFTAICQAIEQYDPSLIPSVLLRDPESNTLHSGAGSSLPQHYLDAVEGAPVGPNIGT